MARIASMLATLAEGRLSLALAALRASVDADRERATLIGR